MARTDAIVLGAGIVGTSIALQLARRGLRVALVDRRAPPGEETSYGNAGIVEGKSVCPIVLHPSGTEIGSVYQVLSRGNQEIGKSTHAASQQSHQNVIGAGPG